MNTLYGWIFSNLLWEFTNRSLEGAEYYSGGNRYGYKNAVKRITPIKIPMGATKIQTILGTLLYILFPRIDAIKA